MGSHNSLHDIDESYSVAEMNVLLTGPWDRKDAEDQLPEAARAKLRESTESLVNDGLLPSLDFDTNVKEKSFAEKNHLVPAMELNTDFAPQVNPCDNYMPCVAVGKIDQSNKPSFIPEGKDAVQVSVYGMEDGKLGNKSIYFTPDDGKIYVLDPTTSTDPKIYAPQITGTDRSGGRTIKYEDGTVIRKNPEDCIRDNPNLGYVINSLGYHVNITKGKAPSSTYDGPDLN